jgi:hypothetical protein
VVVVRRIGRVYTHVYEQYTKLLETNKRGRGGTITAPLRSDSSKTREWVIEIACRRVFVSQLLFEANDVVVGKRIERE